MEGAVNGIPSVGLSVDSFQPESGFSGVAAKLPDILERIIPVMERRFGLFYNIPQNSGPLFSVTQTIDTYVYRALMQTNNISNSTAASLFQNVIGFICIMIANTIVKKIDEDSSLF